jgi:twitching motility protein PilT
MNDSEQGHLLGRIAVHLKMITMDQLAEVTRGLQGDQTPIGEILLLRGWIDQQQLDQMIQYQKEYLARRQETGAGKPPEGPKAGRAPAPRPAATASGSPAAAIKPVAAPAAAPKAAPKPPATQGAAAKPGPSKPAAAKLSVVPPLKVAAAPAAEPAVVASRPGTAARATDRSGRLDALLTRAVQAQASDLHLHSGAPVKMRIHGEITDQDDTLLTASEAESMITECLTPEQKDLFEKNGELDFAYTLAGVGRFRANVYRQQRGVDGVFRVIPPAAPKLEDLGLPSTLAKVVNFHQGLVLLTGPAGCGKSSTMAALVNILNEERRDHILTIEDPIEYLHPSKRCIVNQRQVARHTESFARALRAALREDPDVIVIGELRDQETIALALSAAETGHLVLGTLHTNNAIRTINRVLGVFPPNQQAQIRIMISESLKAIVSQRLLPRADRKGRVAALEILMCNRAVGNLIREGKTFQILSVLQTGAPHGMCLMESSLAALLKSGAISKDEALRWIEDPKRLAA